MIEDIRTGRGKLGYLASLTEPTGRRTFLKWSGMTVAVLGAACSDDNQPLGPAPEESQNPAAPTGQQPPQLINFGSGDTGVLNYAYALEQLEAAFYTMVVANPRFQAIFNADEQQVLIDLRNHEVAHREFLKAVLGNKAIPALQVDFSSINFDSRAQVLLLAKTFEDLGVAAYNGAGRLLSDPNNLTVAGKIVSVEGRHAAAIRSLLNPKSEFFAGDDVVNPVLGLDGALTSGEVLPMADPFIIDRFDTRQLPAADRQPIETLTLKI
jgi:hypothetical protein